MFAVIAKETALILCSYLLGCCTAGYYLTLWRTGKDIRLLNGGNTGARNVGRILGPSGFLVTFLFDFTKGAVTVWAGSRLHFGSEAIIASMVAVVAGHIWPVQLRFYGGRGVATTLGALCLYSGRLELVGLCVFIPALLIFRKLTLSGMIAFALTPLAAFLADCTRQEIAAVSILSALLLFTHRTYIREEIADLMSRRPHGEPVAPPEEDQDDER